jgi:hypothetical protein
MSLATGYDATSWMFVIKVNATATRATRIPGGSKSGA